MAMPQARNSFWAHIGKALHVQHDDTLREPLPRRWVDLIRYLNEKDRALSQARQRGTERSTKRKIRKN
jgi:hypothetical protein